MNELIEIGKRAKAASKDLAITPAGQRDRALEAIAAALESNTGCILEANAKDMDRASDNGISISMQDRLKLTEERINGIAKAVRDIANQDDPIGKIISGNTAQNGMTIMKKTVPLGVIATIYESRPNVTPDIAALCIKTANACILRGGKEAIHSNIALVKIIREAVVQEGLPQDSVILIEDTSRESATALMKLDGYVDLLFPRGGKGLIRSVIENATVPVIETGAGVCHVYVDEDADLTMAAEITDNAKTSRPSVCNAAETLLVHRAVAQQFLPLAAISLAHANVELRCCPESLHILGGGKVLPATEDDWAEEYGDNILAVKVVSGIDEAIWHIGEYSTSHSDAIVTSNYANAAYFCDRVDSAAVYVNASTRFTDGGVFGMGAEIGISTQKLHARGPMGIEHLTSYKYVVYGNGQLR